MNVQDRVIIVTGASSGIGEATARLLAKRGAKMALVARSLDKLKRLEHELPGSYAVAADMTDMDAVRRMVGDVHDHFGRLDGLVNNAGRGGAFLPLEQENIQEFRDLMELNVYGLIAAMQAAIPYMREAGGGAIVNIGSGTTKYTRAGYGFYPATKHVVHHLSMVSRLELADDHISVSVVHPYITATNFFGDPNSDRVQEMLKQADPPERVAEAVLQAIQEGTAEIDLATPHMHSR